MSECRHPNILPLVGVIQNDSGHLAAIAMPRGDHDLRSELLCVPVLLLPRAGQCLSY